MTCLNCQKQLSDGDRFCTGCGTQVTEPGQPHYEQQPQQQPYYEQPQQQYHEQPQQAYQQPQQYGQQQYHQPYQQQPYQHQQPAAGAPQEWYRNTQVQYQPGQPQHKFSGGKSGYFTLGERNIETDRTYTAEEIMERLCQHAHLPGAPYYHKYGKEYFVYIPGTGTKDMCVNHSWFPGKFVLEEVDRPGTFGKSVLMAGLTSGWADVAEYATSNLNQLMDQVANELWRLFGSHLKEQ